MLAASMVMALLTMTRCLQPILQFSSEFVYVKEPIVLLRQYDTKSGSINAYNPVATTKAI